MKLKLTMMLGAAVIVFAAACSSSPPPPPPGPDPDSIAREQARQDSLAREQARADSIARARQMEEQRIAREREEAARQARMITERVANMMATRINFDFDKYAVRAGADTEALEGKVAIMRANSAVRIEVVGHADERGSDEYNLALGNRRAIAARDFMVNRGIDASRITVRSMGERQPLDNRSNEDAWEANRRDEFRITAGGNQLVMPSGM
jgi:peptidoglycan-associated lipoprotein